MLKCQSSYSDARSKSDCSNEDVKIIDELNNRENSVSFSSSEGIQNNSRESILYPTKNSFPLAHSENSSDTGLDQSEKAERLQKSSSKSLAFSKGAPLKEICIHSKDYEQIVQTVLL